MLLNVEQRSSTVSTEPFSALLYDLRQRLARLVVEHEPEFLGDCVDREIAGFLATVPSSQVRRLTFAINLMRQRMMIPGGGVSDRPVLPERLEIGGISDIGSLDDPSQAGPKAA